MNPELIAYLLSWAVFYTGYNIPVDLPIIKFVPNEYFIEKLCRYRENPNDPCNILAMYDDEHDGIIYINKKFYTGINANLKGTFIHETVHYLQDMSGKWKDMKTWNISIKCQERQFREREARMVQVQYMADVHGIKAIPQKYKKCK